MKMLNGFEKETEYSLLEIMIKLICERKENLKN